MFTPGLNGYGCGWELRETEKELNAIGYRLLQSGLKDDAIKIFRWNTELFPESWNAWDSYGEGLANAGQTVAAIKAYQKSIELNPENKAGVEMLNKLKEK
jgi:tetratricopeptide (TPR) repeat protein